MFSKSVAIKKDTFKVKNANLKYYHLTKDKLLFIDNMSIDASQLEIFSLKTKQYIISKTLLGGYKFTGLYPDGSILIHSFENIFHKIHPDTLETMKECEIFINIKKLCIIDSVLIVTDDDNILHLYQWNDEKLECIQKIITKPQKILDIHVLSNNRCILYVLEHDSPPSFKIMLMEFILDKKTNLYEMNALAEHHTMYYTRLPCNFILTLQGANLEILDPVTLHRIKHWKHDYSKSLKILFERNTYFFPYFPHAVFIEKDRLYLLNINTLESRQIELSIKKNENCSNCFILPDGQMLACINSIHTSYFTNSPICFSTSRSEIIQFDLPEIEECRHTLKALKHTLYLCTHVLKNEKLCLPIELRILILTALITIVKESILINESMLLEPDENDRSESMRMSN